MIGWISVHRKFQDNWIWKSKEPFDKRSAWISILFKTNYEDTKVMINNMSIEVKKGSFITSESRLAKEWKWGRKRVRTFLESLEKDNMITKNGTTKYTMITVVNWELYQKTEQQRNNIGTIKETMIAIDTSEVYGKEEQQEEQIGNSKGTQKETSEGTTLSIATSEVHKSKGQQEEQERDGKRNTENKYNNNIIYLYLLNKYSVENRKNFNEYMKKTRELRNDEKWNELTRDEQQKILSEL